MEYPTGITQLPSSICELYKKCVTERSIVIIMGDPMIPIPIPKRGPLPSKVIVIGTAVGPGAGPNRIPGTVSITPVESSGFQALIDVANMEYARKRAPKVIRHKKPLDVPNEKDMLRLENYQDSLHKNMTEHQIRRAAFRIKVCAKKVKYFINNYLC